MLPIFSSQFFSSNKSGLVVSDVSLKTTAETGALVTGFRMGMAVTKARVLMTDKWSQQWQQAWMSSAQLYIFLHMDSQNLLHLQMSVIPVQMLTVLTGAVTTTASVVAHYLALMGKTNMDKISGLIYEVKQNKQNHMWCTLCCRSRQILRERKGNKPGFCWRFGPVLFCVSKLTIVD